MKIFLLIILLGYIVPTIISLIGFITFDFKKGSVEDLYEFMMKSYDDYFSPITFVIVPVLNLACSIIYLAFLIWLMIKLPFILADRKYHIWDKIKNYKVK